MTWSGRAGFLQLPPQFSLWGSPVFLFFCVPHLYVWGSPVFFFFCVPQLYVWGSPVFFFFCVPQLYVWGSPFFFFFCVPQLYLWGSPFFFFFCVPSYISGVHHSSYSAFPAISLRFTILLLLRSHLYLWGLSFFFFFCVPSSISGVHISFSSAFPAISLGFTILLLLLHSPVYLWGSPVFFFCVPSYTSGVHHSSSSSAFPAISLGFTILLLLLRSQLYLWGSPFFFFCVPQLYLCGSPFFFFCIPSYISGVHRSSSSSAFPAIYLGFTISGVPSFISGVHHSSSSSAFPSFISGVHHSSSTFPAMSLGLTTLLLRPQLDIWASPFWVRFLHMWPLSNPTIEVVTFRLCGGCVLGVFWLPAFTRLRHECQGRLNLCDGMHVHRQDLGLYSHPKEVLGNGVRTHVTPREISAVLEAQRRIKPAPPHHAGQRANTLPTELFCPHSHPPRQGSSPGSLTPKVHALPLGHQCCNRNKELDGKVRRR